MRISHIKYENDSLENKDNAYSLKSSYEYDNLRLQN